MRNLLFFLAVLASAVAADARNPKIAPDTDIVDSGIAEVIVQFRHAPGSAHNAKIVAHGGVVKANLSLVKALHASLPANQLERLATDPEVAYISPDRQLAPAGTTISFNIPAPAVNAPYAWNFGYNGTGIGVAVIDSGTQDAADLQDASKKNRIIFKQSYIAGTTGTVDVYGHGMHVTGLIAGNGQSSNGQYVGVAPNAKILNFRVLNDNGLGQDSYVISAIQAAINLKNIYNIRVINLSLGRPVYESETLDPLCQAVEQAWKAGIVVVVAAGNEGRNNSVGTYGYGSITSPGNDPLVITVGAMKQMGDTRSNDLIASYSSKGPTAIDHIVKPDIVAPGNRVVSVLGKSATLLSNDYPQNIVSKVYLVLSGTSMATGVASGAVADLLEANPALTPDQVKAILMASASKSFPQSSSTYDAATGITYVSQYDVFTIGAGYLDLQNALSEAFNPPPPNSSMNSPVATYDTSSADVYFVSDQHALWGSSSIWDSHALWGSNVFVGTQATMWGSGALWGSHALWGSSTDTGFSALWGSHALWGSASSDATEALSLTADGEN
jgi:serine protease AprX